jgi:hypothetical protein
MKNIFETVPSGGGGMFHSISSFMNKNKMGAHRSFDCYLKEITPSLARLVSAADKERIAV